MKECERVSEAPHPTTSEPTHFDCGGGLNDKLGELVIKLLHCHCVRVQLKLVHALSELEHGSLAQRLHLFTVSL